MKRYIIAVICLAFFMLCGMYVVPRFLAQVQAETEGSMHNPYTQGLCVMCHGEGTPSKERVKETPEMCVTCHGKIMSQTYLHSPVSIGDCLLCHAPHQAENPSLLRFAEPELCYLCHMRIEDVMSDEQNVVHEPAAGKCSDCHEPHGSDSTNTFLQQDMATLCTECHLEEDVPMQRYVAEAAFKHQPVEEGGKCIQCHTAHASPFEFHLTAEPLDLCMQCHNQEVAAYDGKTLANMQELLEQSEFQHGSIRSKDCSSCHNPHGGEHFRILNAAYPESFYTEEYSVENYELCFSCHESNILNDRETTTLTNFRDGARNLHYLHVNRETKGRTCRACHETHASNFPKHVREAVPFGKINWPLELQYQIEYADVNTGEACDTPNETCVKTGGSCVACHARVSYNYTQEAQ